MKLTREEALKKIILNDVDSILSDHPERDLYEMLENGCTGYKTWTDKDIIEYFDDHLCEELIITDDVEISKPHVVFYPECIEVHDKEGKILCWTKDEWKEDAEVPFYLANGIVRALNNELLP